MRIIHAGFWEELLHIFGCFFSGRMAYYEGKGMRCTNCGLWLYRVED